MGAAVEATRDGFPAVVPLGYFWAPIRWMIEAALGTDRLGNQRRTMTAPNEQAAMTEAATRPVVVVGVDGSEASKDALQPSLDP